MNMCEWMISFSILGKLLYRQRQTILLPLFHCALYCCSVMINIKKGGDLGYSIWKLINASHQMSLTRFIMLITTAMSDNNLPKSHFVCHFLNIDRKRGEGWRMMRVFLMHFLFLSEASICRLHTDKQIAPFKQENDWAKDAVQNIHQNSLSKHQII